MENEKTELTTATPQIMSATISKLATALAIAQGEMEGAKKDATNPFFNSVYATLDSVVTALRLPLSKNGLSYVQLPYNAAGRVGVRTMLMHNSGEWISSTFELMPVKNDPQSLGSTLTYCRRYTLMAIVGIAPEDDDGNGGSAPDKKPTYDKKANAQAEFERKKFAKPETLADAMADEKMIGEPTPAELKAILNKWHPDLVALAKRAGYDKPRAAYEKFIECGSNNMQMHTALLAEIEAKAEGAA